MRSKGLLLRARTRKGQIWQINPFVLQTKNSAKAMFGQRERAKEFSNRCEWPLLPRSHGEGFSSVIGRLQAQVLFGWRMPSVSVLPQRSRLRQTKQVFHGQSQKQLRLVQPSAQTGRAQSNWMDWPCSRPRDNDFDNFNSSAR
jgi:hypothetical protein